VRATDGASDGSLAIPTYLRTETTDTPIVLDTKLGECALALRHGVEAAVAMLAVEQPSQLFIQIPGASQSRTRVTLPLDNIQPDGALGV
jgi:hypothetical protein